MAGAGSLTQQITATLIDSHRGQGWRAEKEALFSPRRIDVLAISPGGCCVVGFEVKVSRTDFMAELSKPDKRGRVIRNCTYFYFVAPEGLVDEAEIPAECGFLEYNAGEIEVSRWAPGHRDLRFPVYWNSRDCGYSNETISEFFHGDRGEAEDCLPAWALPRIVRPLRLQFDVSAAANKIPQVNVDTQVNFNEVPF